MIIIVDSNILFSACISPNSKISEILFSPLPHIQRISCYYAIAELFKHQKRIIKLSKLSPDKLNLLFYAMLRQVEFLNENMIDAKNWREADALTSGVDSNDISFVALALQKNGCLWTGDKKLTEHLRKNNFNEVINTTDLYNLLEIG
jgi:predicted nucleic acid-binding protein